MYEREKILCTIEQKTLAKSNDVQRRGGLKGRLLTLSHPPLNFKYVFIHTKSSDIEISIDIKKFKDNDILIINPNSNMYDTNDKFFLLANEFINKPFF